MIYLNEKKSRVEYKCEKKKKIDWGSVILRPWTLEFDIILKLEEIMSRVIIRTKKGSFSRAIEN